MNDFVSKVMKTIASIQQHIEKNGREMLLKNIVKSMALTKGLLNI